MSRVCEHGASHHCYGDGTVIVAAMLGFGHRSWDSRFSWVKSVPSIRFYPYYYIDVNKTLKVRAICTVREGWICSKLMDLPYKWCPMSWHDQMCLESWKSCLQCKIVWIFQIWPPFGDRMFKKTKKVWFSDKISTYILNNFTNWYR